jgi:hypothetical protein
LRFIASNEFWEESMTNTGQPKEEKKAYTKPSLTEVRLMAEEAVLGICKLGDGVQETCGSTPSCLDEAGS